MKSTLMKVSLGVAVAASLLLAGPSAMAEDKYLKDPFDRPVKDPFDRCILTIGGVDFPECSGVAPAPQEPTIETMALSADAFFDFDKATLKPAGRASLDTLVSDLGQVQQVNSIDVVGHTDSVGSEQYNQGLSERRASSVRDYMVSKGVSPSLITTSGRGELEPVATNATPEGRAQNRRVEITTNVMK